MTVCDRANFLAETLTQVHRSGQDNVFCAESCQLKHILRNFDLYHNRVTTNFFGKAVSTVLGSLNALDTRYHTRSGQRGIIKTTSHVEPELYKEDDDENFESGLHNQKHKFEQYKFSISRFTAQSKLFEGKKKEWKFICYVVLFLAFSPASPVSSVMLTKHFPSDRCSFFIIRRRTLLQGRWAIFVSHTVRISRLYEQHLPLSVRYFLITKKAPI